MSFDFPSSPTTGQTFTPAGGPAYQWNGYAWTTGAPVAPLGTQVGSAYAELTTLAVTATAMAGAITTVPQQTDGLQFLSVTITPKSVSNKLRFNITSPVSSGSSTAAWMAVFQDSTDRKSVV